MYCWILPFLLKIDYCNQDLTSLGDLLKVCDAARAEACLPRWKDRQCHSVGDCLAVDNACHTDVPARSLHQI